MEESLTSILCSKGRGDGSRAGWPTSGKRRVRARGLQRQMRLVRVHGTRLQLGGTPWRGVHPIICKITKRSQFFEVLAFVD
jgi:hypothetical protein